MENIVLYGVGENFKCFEKTFREFMKEKKIKILGVMDRSLQGEDVFCGFPILHLNEIANLNPDYIIVTPEGEARKSILNDLRNAGIPREKIVDVIAYHLITDKFNKMDTEQLSLQLKVINMLLSATDEEVASFEWMRHVVGQYGIYPFSVQDMNGIGDFVGTRAGMLQRPDEFAKFCVYLSQWRIDTAVEVGVFHGKSSYFMCALLARKNPKLIYELVDITDYLTNFDEFFNLLPQMKKKIPSTSEDYVGKIYDFVFIDADHSYDASIRDYMNVGQYARKLTVFHDIYDHGYDHLNGGTVRMWREVVAKTEGHKHHVFSEYPGKWMGIGVVEYAK